MRADPGAVDPEDGWRVAPSHFRLSAPPARTRSAIDEALAVVANIDHGIAPLTWSVVRVDARRTRWVTLPEG